MYDRLKKLKKFQLQASLKHILALKSTSFFTSISMKTIDH